MITLEPATLVLQVDLNHFEKVAIPRLTSTFQSQIDRPHVIIIALSGISNSDVDRVRPGKCRVEEQFFR
jgi:hypothetical protein